MGHGQNTSGHFKEITRRSPLGIQALWSDSTKFYRRILHKRERRVPIDVDMFEQDETCKIPSRDVGSTNLPIRAFHIRDDGENGEAVYHLNWSS